MAKKLNEYDSKTLKVILITIIITVSFIFSFAVWDSNGQLVRTNEKQLFNFYNNYNYLQTIGVHRHAMVAVNCTDGIWFIEPQADVMWYWHYPASDEHLDVSEIKDKYALFAGRTVYIDNLYRSSNAPALNVSAVYDWLINVDDTNEQEYILFIFDCVDFSKTLIKNAYEDNGWQFMCVGIDYYIPENTVAPEILQTYYS